MKEIRAYQPEDFEREFAEEGDLSIPTNGALAAIYRSAGSNEISFAHANPRETNIEKVGCWLIDSHFILLDWVELPAELRPLVVCISGLSGGNYLDYTPITQTVIGKRLGLHRETVAERIEQLIRWERDNKKALIYIRKNDRDGGEKYKTTEYLPIIVKYAADFIRRLQAKGLRPVNRHQAITDNTVSLYDDTARELIATMPQAEVSNILQPRKTQKNVTPKQQHINFLDSKLHRVLLAVDDYREALRTQSYDMQKAWHELITKEEERFFS